MAKNIINIYNVSLKSKNLTKELILNLINIVQFNESDINNFIRQINSINFRFNILKPFSIENYVEEKISIKKIQKNAKISLKNK